jgi:hypothetical protein
MVTDLIDRWRRQKAAYSRAATHNPQPTRVGINPKLRSLTDTPIALVRVRAETTRRANRIKPSMPKMPWEDET